MTNRKISIQEFVYGKKFVTNSLGQAWWTLGRFDLPDGKKAIIATDCDLGSDSEDDEFDWGYHEVRIFDPEDVFEKYVPAIGDRVYRGNAKNAKRQEVVALNIDGRDVAIVRNTTTQTLNAYAYSELRPADD